MIENLENLTSLEGLRDFIYQPVPIEEYLERDSVWELAFSTTQQNPTQEIADPTIFGWTFDWPWPFSSIAGFFTRAFQAIEDLWNKFISFLSQNPIWWINDTLEKLRDFYYTLRNALAKFCQDPVGFLSGVIDSIVSRIRSFSTNVVVNIGNFIEDIWNRLYNFIKPAFDSIVSLAIQKVQNLWLDFSTALNNLKTDIIDPIGNTFAWLWNQMQNFFTQYITEPVKYFFYKAQLFYDYLLGEFKVSWVYISEFFKTIKLLITQPGEFFKQLMSSIGQITSSDTFRTIWNSVGKAWDWLVDIFTKIFNAIIEEAKKFAPSAPDKGENLLSSGLRLLGIGIGGFGALTGVSMAVSWLSKHHLGHLSAILYDMSSYRLISNALFGGLIFAAYAQPLRYYYNATFRPYLPPFRDAFTAFSRNIIGKKEFGHHLKYAGIPDTYLELYDRLGSEPVSPFLIRGMAEAEIVNPDLIFKYVMDRGYDIKKSIDITGSLLWAASKDYRKAAERSVQKHLIEGYISLEEFNNQIQKIRSLKEYSVSYATIDGETYSGKVYVPLPQEELMAISAQWDAKYDRLKEKENAIKTDLKSGDIDVITAREQLSQFILDQSKIEDIIRECVRELKSKEEPDRGKAIRSSLKSQLRTCYKEGFINKDLYDSLRKEANETTDPNILEDMLAEWSAFYDDRTDQLKYYKEKAINKEITIDELSAKLQEWKMRPSKIDLIINDVVEKILVANRKQREKLNSEIKSLRSKLRDYQDQLASLESQIESETNPKKVSTLQAKYESTLAKAAKVEEELSAAEEELKSLAG
jgi:hypothetical protein